MNQRKMWHILILAVLLLGLAPLGVATARPDWSKVDPVVLHRLSLESTTPFHVVLAVQADVSGAELLATKAEKGAYVFALLTRTARETQQPLLAYLQRQGVAFESLYIYNAIIVEAGRPEVEWLVNRPEVARIVAPPETQPDPVWEEMAPAERVEAIEWNITRVKAPDVWAMGFAGEGYVVASNDTGAIHTHNALVNQYRGNLGGGNFDHNYNWWGGVNTPPFDNNGHGTHTIGTMIGDDGGSNQIGVAPGAQWIACAGIGGIGTVPCFQFFLAPWDQSGSNPNPAKAPHAINNSWYDSSGYDFRPIIQNLNAAGIAVIKSAGNQGSGCSTITNPGYVPEIIATAAFAQGDVIASFSSRGPSSYYDPPGLILKPEVAAPGVNVRSADRPNNDSYSYKSGTSMAAPHTTALVTLLWQAAPCIAGDVPTTKQIMMETAEARIDAQCAPFVEHPNNVWGWGVLDMPAAVQMAMAYCSDMGALDGHVRDAVTLAPLSGAAVTAQHTSGWTRNLETDPSGYYTTTAIAGTYTVTAALFGYLPTSVAGVVVITDTVTTQDLHLDLAPTYVVSGYVTQAGSGDPLEAVVTVLGTPLAPVPTDPAGYYAVTLPGGEYTFRVTAPLHNAAQRLVEVDGDRTEDFELEPLACILLVDDDNNAPDVRPYFTAALDTLGYDYDVFDVGGGAGNGPTLDELTGYAMVIWFSGDKYGSSAGPNSTDEANLAAYLDGGGRLFLSSQDYLYDFGLTPFGQDYLGISSFTNDSGNATGKIGVAGDPIGDGLGPYTLDYPSGFSDYGDVVNAGSGASQSFRGENNNNNLDVSKDGGDWQTVFFGTDWVPIYNYNAANGEEVLQRIVEWFGGCGPCEPPADASFDWTPLEPVAGEEVTFTGSAGGTAPLLFQWALGDGGSASGPTVVHTFAEAGDYTVTLTVTNGCGFDLVSQALTVLEPTCDPVEIVTVTTELNGCQVTFGTAFTGTAPYAWLWDFGAFGTSTATNPLVDFDASGTYPYTLTVANACGGDLWADEVTVECAPPCDPVQIVTVTTDIDGCQVTFGTAFTGTAPYDWLWDFGAFGTSTATNPLVDFAASGTYPYTLTVANACGDDLWADEVTVECAPPCDPVQIVTVTTALDGCQVTFGTAFTGTAPYDWLWDFGAFGTSTATNPLVDFAASGTYNYTLTVENACGDDLWADEVTVHCAPPVLYRFYLPLVVK